VNGDHDIKSFTAAGPSVKRWPDGVGLLAERITSVGIDVGFPLLTPDGAMESLMGVGRK
jgi:hypothetical protein